MVNSTTPGVRQDEAGGETDPITAKTAAFQESVQTLQTVLGSTTGDLVRTLTSNLALMRSMQAALDQYAQRAVAVRSRLLARAHLRFRIENGSGGPLASTSVALRVISVGDNVPTSFTLDGTDGGQFHIDKDDNSGSCWRIRDPFELTPSGPWPVYDITFAPFDMFNRYNAVISVTFTGPGSGEVLQRDHVLGIGILHQCNLRFEIGVDVPLVESVAQFHFKAKALRHIWSVPDTIGITTRSVFYARAPNSDELAIHVAALVGDAGSDVSVLCYAPESFPIGLIEEEVLRIRYNEEIEL